MSNRVQKKYRLGIDAGGTFTDFVLSDGEGGVHLFKSPSTPQDGTLAIRAGLAQISEFLGVPPEEIIQNADLCINGTTVALNALIEKKGVKVGLLCTEGHEDSIEIRLGHKEEGYRYDSHYPPAYMLAPRHLRKPIAGRIRSDGVEIQSLGEAAIIEAVKYFQSQNVTSVAISFIWSAVNPAHEKRAREIVCDLMPDAFICTGYEVFPQMREYTRTSTTVVNAYLTPVLASYVARIDQYFEDMGIAYPVRYFQSNGGLALGKVMKRKAVNAINSGPASAPQAAMAIAEPFGLKNVITVDMGGTSFDITLTKDGVTNLNKDIDFLRYRIGVPMIQVETLGAGGGSIAHLNEIGLLEVGPESAGSKPGPACYGKGGERPTVTDANLALGYLTPNAVLGGSIRLDVEKAREALKKHIAEPLGISVERAAYGVTQIVNLNMANGIRRVSIERGYDPRDFALVCAGGAGGMHIAQLADEMGIRDVLVPKVASGLCAFGQTISDVKYNQLSTHLAVLDEDVDLVELNKSFEELEEDGVQNLLADGFSRENIFIKRSMEMRYVGQIHECTVNISSEKIDKKGLGEIIKAFHQRYKELYSYNEPHNPVEVVNIESTMIGRVRTLDFNDIESDENSASVAEIGEREIYVDDSGKPKLARIFDGSKLKGAAKIVGPAIIVEPTTTIVLPADWSASLHESGCYRLTK